MQTSISLDNSEQIDLVYLLIVSAAMLWTLMKTGISIDDSEQID